MINTYQGLCNTLAFYGFTACPMTNNEYNELAALGVGQDEIYGVACDIACGWTLAESLEAITSQTKESNND